MVRSTPTAFSSSTLGYSATAQQVARASQSKPLCPVCGEEGEADSVSHRCLWCSMMGSTPTAAGSSTLGWSAASLSGTDSGSKAARVQRALFLQGLALEPGVSRSEGASSGVPTAGRSARPEDPDSSQASVRGNAAGSANIIGRGAQLEPGRSSLAQDVPSAAPQVLSLERYHEYRRTPSGSEWKVQAVYETPYVRQPSRPDVISLNVPFEDDSERAGRVQREEREFPSTGASAKPLHKRRTRRPGMQPRPAGVSRTDARAASKASTIQNVPGTGRGDSMTAPTEPHQPSGSPPGGTNEDSDSAESVQVQLTHMLDARSSSSEASEWSQPGAREQVCRSFDMRQAAAQSSQEGANGGSGWQGGEPEDEAAGKHQGRSRGHDRCGGDRNRGGGKGHRGTFKAGSPVRCPNCYGITPFVPTRRNAKCHLCHQTMTLGQARKARLVQEHQHAHGDLESGGVVVVIPRAEWPEGGGVAYQRDDSGAFQNAIRECVGSPRRGFAQIGARIFPGDSDWPSELRVPAGWPNRPIRSPGSYYDPETGWGVTAPEPFGAGNPDPIGGPSIGVSDMMSNAAMAPPPGLSAPATGGRGRHEVQVKVLLEGEQVFCRRVRGEEISIFIDRTPELTLRTTHIAPTSDGPNLVDEKKSHAKHPPAELEPAEGCKPPEDP